MCSEIKDLVKVHRLEKDQAFENVLPNILTTAVEKLKEKGDFSYDHWALALQVEEVYSQKYDEKYLGSRRRFLVSDIHPEANPGVKLNLICGGNFAFGVNTANVVVGDKLVVVKPVVRSFDGMIDEALIGFGYDQDWQIFVYKVGVVENLNLPKINRPPIRDSGLKYTEIKKCCFPQDRYNTWGIIRKIDWYPRKTRGSSFMSRVYIQDEFPNNRAPYPDFQLNIFDQSLQNFSPIEVGDVVKVKNMKIEVFNDILTGTLYNARSCKVFKRNFSDAKEQEVRFLSSDAEADFEVLMFAKLQTWWLHYTTKNEFLTNIERPLNEIKCSCLTMLPCKLFEFFEAENSCGGEYKKVIRISDGNQPILLFSKFEAHNSLLEASSVPRDLCIDIFIERTNKLELDASSKGKIAMLLVNCVKENNENDSSFKLVFAGHVYEHFRLLSDDHEYAKQINERLQPFSSIQADFPNSMEFDQMIFSYSTPVAQRHPPSQSVSNIEHSSGQSVQLKSESKRKIQSRDSRTPSKILRLSTPEQQNEESSENLPFEISSSKTRFREHDSTPAIEVYESNNEQLIIEEITNTRKENESVANSTLESYHTVLGSQDFQTSQSSSDEETLQAKTPGHQSSSYSETSPSSIVNETVLARTPRRQKNLEKVQKSSHKMYPSISSYLNSVSDDQSEKPCSSKSNHQESGKEIGPISVTVSYLSNLFLNNFTLPDEPAVIKSVETLDSWPVHNEVVFECRVVHSSVRHDRVWNLFWIKCSACGKMIRGRKPPLRISLRFCISCRGTLEPSLFLETKVVDEGGNCTMLEWGNEACERLFECSAKVFAEDASAQEQVSAKISTLSSFNLLLFVYIELERRRKKFVVVVK